MNEFNPFKELGINPNETQPTYDSLEDTPTESNSVMGTRGQVNPFKELGINPNETPIIGTNKDTEVSSMLGLDGFTPMTDNEKWDYVNSLSDEEWNTWNNLKSEGYSFEARKALMDNQDQLYDINTPGSGKYMQTQEIPTEDKMQSFLDWYQNNIQGFSDRYKEWSNQNINYENKGIGIDNLQETENTAGKKIANVLNSVVSIGVDLLENMVDYSMHKTLGLYNKMGSIQDPNFQPVSWDATNEGYKSSAADLMGIGVDLLQGYVAVANPATYLTLGIISQDEGMMAKIVNGVNSAIEELPKWLIKQPAMQEYLSKPGNEGMEEDIINGITFGIYALLGGGLKKSGKALGNTKAGIKFQNIRNNVARGVQESIKEGKAAGERAKDYNIGENIQGTRMGRSNVRKATIQGMKEGFRKGYNAKQPQGLTDTRITPVTETTVPEEKVNNTEIINRETQELPGEEKPVTEETPKTIKTVENNSELNKLAKETKLSENTIKNLESNPDLQNEFQNTIKPYLEENGKSNPEGVISKPVDDLVYEIKSGIEELKTQQSNLNRSINKKKLSDMERSLIKEVQKIIDQKDSKRIFKSLKQLTPQQKGLVQRVVPDIESKLNTIDQILDLTKEITKRNLVERFLRFQSRPRRGLGGFTKAMIYDFVRGIYEQKGIKASTEAIDKFIEGLSDQEISSIIKQSNGGTMSNENKYSISDLINKIEARAENEKIVDVRRAKKEEIDQRKTDDLTDQGYMPETRLYSVGKDGKMVPHETRSELDLKPFTSDKPLREIFKNAGVNLTAINNRLWDIRFNYEADGVYMGKYDLIAVPENNKAVGVLAHEFGHRVMAQLTEEEKLKIREDIKKGQYNMSNEAADERFAEYFRNYFLYGNIFGKSAEEVLTSIVGKKSGQRIVNVMEKIRNDLFADLGAKDEKDLYLKTRKIDKMIDDIYNLTEKGKEILKRPTERGSRELAKVEAARSLGELEDFGNKETTIIDSEGNPVSEGMNNYMKDSQVRDKNGNLILVRHGTNKKFDEWDQSTAGGRTLNEGYFGRGMYFTDDPYIAQDYSEGSYSAGRDGGDLEPHIEKGYLNITNMFDWNKGFTKEEFKDFVSDLGLSQNKIAHYTNPYNDRIYLLNGYDMNFLEDFKNVDLEEQGYKDLVYGEETLNLSQLTDQLLDLGYDGAYGNNGEYREYIIYDDSNQFKRITNKNPTINENFDLNKSNLKDENTLSLIQKETRGILNRIEENEDGIIVGREHGHETPVYDYIEDSKLPQELKDFLKKQKEEYMKKQDEEVLARLNNM